MENRDALRVVLLSSAVFMFACSEPTRNSAITTAVDYSAIRPRADTSLVRTPIGYIPSACVHEVESGSVVDSKGIVTRKDNSSYSLPPCPLSGQLSANSVTDSREFFQPNSTTTQPDSGVIEAAQLFMPTGNYVTKLLANYTVPAAPLGTPFSPPESYLAYVGIDNGVSFLNPVIQFGKTGAGGSSHWNMSAWHCEGGFGCTYSSLISISAGDAIETATYGVNCPGASCHWFVNISDLTTSKATSTGVLQSQNYTYVTGGRVEVSNLGYCDKYPVNQVAFTLIQIYDKTGALFTPTWSTYIKNTAAPQCRFGVSSTASSVTLAHNNVTVTANGSINASCSGLCTSGQVIAITATGGSAITFKTSDGQTKIFSLSGFTANGGLTASCFNPFGCSGYITSITATGNTITLKDNGNHTGTLTLSGALAAGGATSTGGFVSVTAQQNTIALIKNATNGAFSWINLYR